MRPLSIKRNKPDGLSIAWENGHQSLYSLDELRYACPCAGCRGESLLLQSYVPPPPDRSTPGRYELKGIQQVGSYAIQLQWGDGHATGIYTWDYLIAHCPCEEHLSVRR